MKLNKASEETLKGLARLLKNLKEADGAVALSEFQPDVRAIEKDLRKLRADLKELPEPAQATAQFIEPNVMLFRDEHGLDIRVGPTVSNPQAEQDLEQALNELRALRNEPPVSYGTLTATSVTPNYEVAVYANPEQLAKGANLIAIRLQEEGVFTEALYRKKT